jgi:hypothetical protein
LVNDLWSDQEYAKVLDSVKGHLWTYLQPSASIKDLENAVQNLMSINKRELVYLSTVHFLLSEEVTTFVKMVPRIFHKFSHSSQKENILHKGLVRGRIDWNLTIKERCAKGYDQTVFVCSPTRRVYNLPENQLLKFVLVQIKRLIDETTNLPLAKEIGSRFVDYEALCGEMSLSDRLSWLNYNVNKTLKNIYLRYVDLPMQIDERMVKRTRDSRNKDYETVSASYCSHRELIQKTSFDELKKFIEQKILEPLEKDTLYELYVLFQIVDSLGDSKQINLIRPGAEVFASVKLGEETVKVYYQKPTAVLKESEYKEIFSCYDLDVNLRRPDIILQFEKKNRIVLVEVKRSSDKGYIVDSAYKVLGYLADFKKSFLNNQKPKAALVVWNIKRIEKSNQELVILCHNSLKEGLWEIINSLN